jgi:hypothetical protein
MTLRKGGLAMLRKTLVAIALIALAWGCATTQQSGTAVKGQAPVIVDYYAAKTIRPGDIWKIFLRARDADGDMKYIVSDISQAGYGYYSNSYNRIKKEDLAEFAGFIFLDTPEDESMVDDKLTMTISIEDHHGNNSREITLPLSFSFKARQTVPSQWQAAEKNRLGSIMTSIRPLGELERGG